MGAVKFFDIKCKENDIYPDVVVLNSTIKALKYNGDGDLKKGIGNLEFHIKNMAKYTSNLLVALNLFDTDTKEEIEYVKTFVEDMGYDFTVCSMFANGEDGCIELAEKLIKLKKNKKHYYMYDKEDKLIDKINKVLINEYGAGEVKYDKLALDKLENLKDSKLNICISKTPMSITDDPKVLGYPKGFTMTVSDVNLYNGAGFITILLGGVLTMPGLAKESNYLNMHIDDEGNVSGIR
jgi:formate--tetrahydrofolate ligase